MMTTQAQNIFTRILFMALLPLAFFACGEESDYLLDSEIELSGAISKEDALRSVERDADADAGNTRNDENCNDDDCETPTDDNPIAEGIYECHLQYINDTAPCRERRAECEERCNSAPSCTVDNGGGLDALLCLAKLVGYRPCMDKCEDNFYKCTEPHVEALNACYEDVLYNE